MRPGGVVHWRKLERGINDMTKTLGVFVLMAACLAPAYAQAPKGAGRGAAASATVDAIKQLEKDWSDAQKSRDIEKLRTILAEDWQGLGSDGAISSKRDFLNDVKSGASKLDSFEMGPMDVKVMGRVAVVQGSDTEKSSTKGKDTSGKWVWTDVFVDRDGRWVAVRSQSAMVMK
jgi:ketosteroid isomerase-like protein